MSEPFGQTTRKKLEKLCRNIASANRLNRQQAQRLYCDMEYRLSGYIHGAERISEHDAYILVRKHLGATDNISNLYREAENMETGSIALRKLAAIFISSLGILFGGSIFISAIMTILFPHPLLHMSMNVMLPFLIPVALLFILYFYLIRRWKRQVLAGDQVWFMTMPAFRLALTVMAAVLLGAFILYRTLKYFPGASIYQKVLYEPTILFNCLIWLYWFDTGSKRMVSAVSGFVLWFITNIIFYGYFGLFSILYSFSMMPDTAKLNLPETIMSDLFHHHVTMQAQMSVTMIQYGLFALLIYLMLSTVLAIRQKRIDKAVMITTK